MLDPTSPDKMVLDPTKDIPFSDGLKLYGLVMQAHNGDATGDRPKIYDVKDRALWDAWNR